MEQPKDNTSIFYKRNEFIVENNGLEKRKIGFASPNDFGLKNILLSYIPGNCDKDKNISKETFIPHVAYIQDEKIVDIMFDSFLFLPVVKFLYDGYEKRKLIEADWNEYISSQFMHDRNLDALDEAVDEVKKQLNLPDYRAKIFFSIFYPVETIKDFGKVNDRILNFKENDDDRYTAVKWMIDEQIRLFSEKKYKNLEIAGFYWFTESIDTKDSKLLDLINKTTTYVRKLGFISTWIPYFGAEGFDEWNKIGFDLACYQPNYAFNFSVPRQRLFEAIAQAKHLNMALEIEIGKFSLDDAERLKDYFDVSKETGVMTDSIHMYYQDVLPGVFYKAYESKDPALRSVYDDLYKFIAGKY